MALTLIYYFFFVTLAVGFTLLVFKFIAIGFDFISALVDEITR